MTGEEYRDFVRRFTSGQKWVRRFDPIEGSSPQFSWSSCDICDRPNCAGNRTECTWQSTLKPLGSPPETSTALVCDDCLYFQEYGRLDDLTMDGLS